MGAGVVCRVLEEEALYKFWQLMLLRHVVADMDKLHNASAHAWDGR